MPKRNARSGGVNLPWAFDETLRCQKAGGKDCRVLETQRLEGLDEENETEIASMFLDPPFVPSVCPLNPFRLNERLRLQKAIFLIPGDITIPFEENLRALNGHEDEENMVRIVIPRGLHAEAIEQLYYMNITRTSLFPGLDGYSRALRVYHPIFNPKGWDDSPR